MARKGIGEDELDQVLLRDARKNGRRGAFVISIGSAGLLSARLSCSTAIFALLGADSSKLRTFGDWLSLAVEREELERTIRHDIARLQRRFDPVIRLRRADDGREILIRASAEMERGRDGERLRISGTIEDIGSSGESDQAEFKAALYASGQEASLDGILVVGGGDRILSYNRKFVEMWGVPEALVRSGDDGAVLPYVKEQSRDPEAFLKKVRYLYGHREKKSLDTVTLKDGRIFDRYSAPVVGEGGRYFGRIWHFRDVTDSRKAEESLRLSELAFRSLFDFPMIGVAVVTERKMARSNPAFLGMMGYTEQEVLGRSARMFYDSDEEFERAGTQLYAEIDSGGLSQVETRFVKKDGAAMDALLFARRLEPDHPEKGIVLIALDVTSMKAAERDGDQLRQQLAQAQKMESIGRLAGGVAHDFNNLLTAIIGNAELALAKLPPGYDASGFLSSIIQAGESAAELTSQLLAFSRKQIINPRIVILNDIIEQMKKILARIIGEDIDLQARTQPDLPTVSVDPAQIQQIILNLAVNGRDAMPSGGCLALETAIVVLDDDYCSRHPGVEPGPRVMLSVSDTGQGMSEETMSHLFEPFFTTKAPGKGTGLGLATVYGAVKQNGGVIDVSSALGKGTVFKVYFPYAGGQRAAAAEPRTAEGGADGGTETILLAEDNGMVLQFALDVLSARGYRVISASSGEAALIKALASEEPIDLLLTDIVMQGMNGKALADELRRFRPTVKVLFCSGYTENIPNLQESLDSGDGFIAKPFTAASLLKKLRQMLDAR
jgi:two-component system, cell cycle sensor histidine kinase and response regulator CckA